MAAMTRRVGVPRGADEESGARMGSGGGGAGMGGMGSGALDGADQFMADKAQLAVGGAVVLGLLAVLMLPVGVACVVFVLEVCAAGVAFSLWLSRYILSRDEGTPEMQEISNPIKEGAEGFLKVQYTAIFRIAALLAVVIMFSYLLRPIDTQNPQGVERLGNFMLGLLASVSFILGALCSAAAGYISMWVSANSNIRVASAATRSYGEALLVCFRGGAFSAVLDITLCVFGVTMLYVIYYLLFASTGVITPTDVPMLLVGYGFGASFVALFMQLGGGIYTKAADVGADLVGKIEHGIPEDDPRNPAVIADLVGDMVGDCVGSSADVFESVAAEIIGAMILSSTLAAEANIENPIRFVFFPLIVHALDIVVSSVGILSVRHKGGAISASPSGGSAAAGGAGVGAGGASASSAGDATAAGSALGGSSAVDGVGGSGGGVVGGGVDGSGMPTAVNGADGLAADGGNTTSGGMVDKGPPPGAANQARLAQTSNPMDPFVFGYRIAAALAFIAFGFTARFLLYVEASPSAWLHYYGCGIVGMLTGYIFIQSTQYFTDYEFAPVRSIAEASTTGHGTNIITGVAVGMKSTVIPCITVSLAVVMSYHLGFSAGVGAGHNAGLFGTAVATMGMLSSAAFVLSMNNFGPVADNAGGIVEMSRQAEYVRTTTDRLDAAGNVTKAITKGYSIGSAALACFLLFGAFLDEFSQFSGVQFRVVDIAVPEVLVGGLLGSGMVFYFTGLTVAAVGKTASEVVVEVRRQLRDNPEIMNFRAQPDYRSCVSIVTRAALREMRYPGILAVGMPVLTGLTFRFVGYFTNRPMLGAEVLASYLMFATVTGILMALFLDNVGGAWDNAKKYIEAGHYGGKGSEAHKAAITGDTVGDPFKDTAGPSLHVVIKLLSTTVLVMGPLFVNS